MRGTLRPMTAAAAPAFAVHVADDGTRRVALSGRWTVWTVAAIDSELRTLEQHPALHVTFDLGAVALIVPSRASAPWISPPVEHPVTMALGYRRISALIVSGVRRVAGAPK